MPSTGNLSCEGERDVSGLELSEKVLSRTVRSGLWIRKYR